MLLGETQESLKERGTGTETAFKLPLRIEDEREGRGGEAEEEEEEDNSRIGEGRRASGHCCLHHLVPSSVTHLITFIDGLDSKENSFWNMPPVFLRLI